jgi:hypothetical protein
LKTSLLLSIYDKIVPKNKSQDGKFNPGLKVLGGRVVSVLTGLISKDYNAVLTNYGYGYSG